ncbi:MAG TPA: glutathione synthase [Gammaproteobacteria bacterium]|nr:glutathione synthase [Gammaproteobacteria bacterium]
MATTSPQFAHGSRLAVVMDPIEAIHPAKDTTLALLLEAQRRGYSPYYVRPGSMWAAGGAAWARVQPLQVRDSESDWFSLGEIETVALENFDVILMRKDPPFDQEYVYLTYLLELAESAGARVVNRPRALRDYNEKASILKFPDLTPPTLIACDIESFREFHRLEEHIVIKPLDGMGGRGVFVLGPGDTNLSSVVEMLTENGIRHAMAQRYLPAIRQGDKRVLVVAGKAVPYMLARLPATGESRGNLAAGGRGEPRPLGKAEKRIAETVGPHLAAAGLDFVGLDIIGESLTEINVTSPTCVRELDRAYGLNIAGDLFKAIESRNPENTSE